MRKKKSVGAVLLLLFGMLLGGTVFRAQVADAAAILQVKVVNSESNPVPVDQQGTADVNVTNGSLDVSAAPPAAVTRGGQRSQVDVGQTSSFGTDLTASALVIQFRDGASELLFLQDGAIVARFPGPGPLALALHQPLSFDSLRCGGSAGYCDVGWAGSAS